MRLPIASGVATLAVATTLYPLFDSTTWLWTVVGAILTVTVLGVLADRFNLPLWAMPLASLLGLTLYMTAVFARDEAWLWVIPNWDSVTALAELWNRGFGDIQRFAAPVPDQPGIVALTAVGVGVIAVLVDLFAVRARVAALAGLPLLALFTVPAAVIVEPIAWPSFILAAFGYLVLLVADGRERVSRWGRAVLVRRRPGPGDVTGQRHQGPLRLSGKRIGFAAVALAVLLPTVVPDLAPNPLFGFGVGSGLGRGNNTISIPNPIAGLRGQLTLPEEARVMTYSSADGNPRYLRTWSLDVFDGEAFEMTPPTGRPQDRVDEGPLPPPPGMSGAVPAKSNQLRVQMSPELGKLSFLPLPYPAAQIGIEGDWRADRSTLVVFSHVEYAAGLSYNVVSNEPRPSGRTLDEAGPAPVDIATRYLQLPDSLPESIRDLARRETRTGKTPFQKAVQLQKWFTERGGFTYQLRTEGHSASALEDFLLYSRAGYCEQFAVSMAVLARILDIPARVAIGYTGGTRIGDSTWEVTTRDTHAWPELYFEGAGWLAFEPTPTGAAGQGTGQVPEYTRFTPPSAADSGTETETDTPASTPEEEETAAGTTQRNQGPLDREGAAAPVTVEEETPVLAWIAAGTGVLLLILLIPALIRVLTRTRRLRAVGSRAVVRLWAELDDMLYDYGMSRGPSESSRAMARRLTEKFEFGQEAAGAVARVASATERLMYARDPGTVTVSAEDVETVRKALAASVTRGRRMRATLLPPSTFARFRVMSGRVLDGFDWLESVGARSLTRRLARK
ncbi:transglutaminase family protein [Sinosporangium siamense]|uniref:Transglutaminase n=1 Tax=Sinosporangium siamense TaxID=1367973 RepID=A0A919RAC8_9ACTN|nr:DUF3488 and transglutaminase-like domain-containing protein [Sinosporangium siamense]GII90310.1 transglutaminase [Sinosporangium siamense]